MKDSGRFVEFCSWAYLAVNMVGGLAVLVHMAFVLAARGQ